MKPVTITKIVLSDSGLFFGPVVTDSDRDYWLDRSVSALRRHFPGVEVELGTTDSRGSLLRIESDDDGGDLTLAYQEAVQVLERIF